MEVHSDPTVQGHSALRGVTARSLLTCLREAVAALHGEYGLACVQYSLNGESKSVIPIICVCCYSMCLYPSISRALLSEVSERGDWSCHSAMPQGTPQTGLGSHLQHH